jgi:hypothetical protein
MTSISRATVSSPARAARLARPHTTTNATTNPTPRAPTPRPTLPLSSRPLLQPNILTDADALAFQRLRLAVLQAGRGPWRTLRPLARRLFGADAFVRAHDGAPARLRLTRAHLAQLATTPQQTAGALRALRRDGKLAEVGGGLGPGFGPEAASRLYATLAQQALAPLETALRLATVHDGRVAHLAEAGGADRAAACPRGHGILARWATWVDVDDGGATVRVVSIHRPPPRDSALGALFTTNLERLVDNARGAAWVG